MEGGTVAVLLLGLKPSPQGWPPPPPGKHEAFPVGAFGVSRGMQGSKSQSTLGLDLQNAYVDKGREPLLFSQQGPTGQILEEQ